MNCPKEVKLKMPIELIESRTMQNVNMASDITPFHAKFDILLPNETIDLRKFALLRSQ